MAARGAAKLATSNGFRETAGYSWENCVVKFEAKVGAVTEDYVFFVELTVPWEDAVDEDNERKMLRYVDLEAEMEQRGWRGRVGPVEIGCRGFVGRSKLAMQVV